jgi:hypothetical protein
VPAEDFVAQVGSAVTQCEVVTVLFDVAAEPLFEQRVVVVAHHERRQTLTKLVDRRVCRRDLVSTKRVRCRQRRRVKARRNDVTLALLVVQTRREQSLVCRRGDDVVQRLLEAEA